MTLTVLGWAVVHSVWQGAFIAVLTALVLGCVPDRRAGLRHTIAIGGLILMAVAPVVTAVAAADLLGAGNRFHVTRAIESTVGLPAVVSWRAVVVPAGAALWLTGLALCFARIGAEWRRAYLLGREDIEASTEEVRAIVAGLRDRLSIHIAVDVRRSARATVPMVLGWRRPRILLPTRTAASLGPSQLRAVLAHELAHVRRRDYLSNLVQVAVETLLFHHPGAWWLSRRIRTDREYRCDDVAISVGADAVGYARALAALDDARDGCRLAVAAASGTLLDRIQRIVGQPRPVLKPGRAVLALTMASVLASAIFALATAVPPSLPLSVRLRSKGPAPAGAPMPAGTGPSKTLRAVR